MVYNIMNTVTVKIDKLDKAVKKCDEDSIILASGASEWLERAWFAPAEDLPEGIDIKKYDYHKKRIADLLSEFKDKCSCRSK